MGAVEFITDSQIYQQVIIQQVCNTKKFLLLATSDLKDLYIHKGSQFVPFLELLAELIKNGVEVRLLHAKEPGPNFRKDFDKYPVLASRMERILCPRVHFKSIVVDGKFAYCGSANLTGAGMGAKSDSRRNFEAGFITEDKALINAILDQFDSIWMGSRCPTCNRKEFCTDYRDLILK
jgi:phosphatidylserine/phosphatidylglycerophosphate/cardiolipin synthase-like enzyme